MTIEKRLDVFENEIKEIRKSKLEIDEHHARLQMLLQRMEQRLNYYEKQKQQIVVNHGQVLSNFGFMSQPKQLEHKLREETHSNTLEVNITSS